MGVVHSRISESSDQQAIWRHSLQFFAWQQEPTPKLRPRQRPSHGTAMVAFTATVSQPGVAMATARGLLMLMLSPRLMLTSDMVDSTAMVLVWAMAATAMEALATDTARGPLMLRPSPRPMLTSDMVDSTAMVLVWAMAAMAMEVLATTARGPLRPSLRPMLTSDMVDSTATVLVAIISFFTHILMTSSSFLQKFKTLGFNLYL